MHLTDNPLYIQPKNTMPRIHTLWAFVSVDKLDGNEGVLCTVMGESIMPLIASDGIRLAELRPIAEKIAKQTKIKAKLVKFTHREELEEFNYEE